MGEVLGAEGGEFRWVGSLMMVVALWALSLAGGGGAAGLDTLSRRSS